MQLQHPRIGLHRAKTLSVIFTPFAFGLQSDRSRDTEMTTRQATARAGTIGREPCCTRCFIHRVTNVHLNHRCRPCVNKYTDTDSVLKNVLFCTAYKTLPWQCIHDSSACKDCCINKFTYLHTYRCTSVEYSTWSLISAN